AHGPDPGERRHGDLAYAGHRDPAPFHLSRWQLARLDLLRPGRAAKRGDAPRRRRARLAEANLRAGWERSRLIGNVPARIAEQERGFAGAHRAKQLITNRQNLMRLVWIQVRREFLVLRPGSPVTMHHVDVEIDVREAPRRNDDFADDVDVHLARVLFPHGTDESLTRLPDRQDRVIGGPSTVDVDARRRTRCPDA